MVTAAAETRQATMTAAEFEANQPREGRFELLAGEMVELAAGMVGKSDRIEVPDVLLGFSVPAREILCPRSHHATSSEPEPAE